MTSLAANRVQENSTIVGTGVITLAGATSPAMSTFGSAFADGSLCGYIVLNLTTPTEWEQGVGTYAAGTNTIARTYTTAGSNGTSPVNFSVGGKLVLNAAPTSTAAQPWDANHVYIPGDTSTVDGNTWYALNLSVNSSPTSTNTNWAQLGGAGTPGKAATIAVGTTTTGDPGTDATVVNSGTSSAAVFDFTIPAGDQGPKGDPGAPAAPAPDYITGYYAVSATATSVTVSSGSAYVQAIEGALTSAGNLIGTLSGAAANTWYHVYLYESSGTPLLQISSTSPADPYFGYARSMGSDTTKRYLFSVLTDASAHIVPFTMLGTKMRYLTTPAVAPFRVLSGGTATTSTTIDLSGALPATARIAHARLLNNATAGQVYIGNPDMGAASFSNYMTTARTTSEFESELLTDASQAINYVYNASPGSGCNIDVNGYEFER